MVLHRIICHHSDAVLVCISIELCFVLSDSEVCSGVAMKKTVVFMVAT